MRKFSFAFDLMATTNEILELRMCNLVWQSTKNTTLITKDMLFVSQVINMPMVENFEVKADKLKVNRIRINRICSSQI
jgi:hypothetical protein